MRHSRVRGKDLHSPSRELVLNSSGSTIGSLKAVTINSFPASYPLITIANSISIIVRGITENSIPNSTTGFITSLGFLIDVDTSPWVVGTVLYNDGLGNLTGTPLGLPLARVLKQSILSGVLYVDNQGITLDDINLAINLNNWSISGNASTNPAVNFLGTTDDVSLIYKTNGISAGAISNLQRFGFGTTDPQLPLHYRFGSSNQYEGRLCNNIFLQTTSTTYSNAYSFPIPDLHQIVVSVTMNANDNTNRACFKKTAAFYRSGGFAGNIGSVQSDYTFKSNNGYGLKLIPMAYSMIVQVKAPTANATNWSGFITIDATLAPGG